MPPLPRPLARHHFLGALSWQGESHFRVWAPQAKHVSVVFEACDRTPLPLSLGPDGYYTGAVRNPGTAGSGSQRYRYQVDGRGPWPDPCSRFQPQGVHGPSMIVDADAFPWSDANWRGARLHGQVIYELHIGAFTPQGTFDAAAEKLTYLRDLGISMIEIMPVAECPGRWNWGYDGVQLYAPYHVLGDHEAFKRLVDRAHSCGLAVILDVVYNHLGPDGNYLGRISPHYFSTRHQTEWGTALNFDGEHALGARDFVLNNARYWIREFHLDGLRLDATQSIFDTSTPHIVAEIVAAAREAGQPRDVIIIAENEKQLGWELLPPQRGGHGLDAMWNDDFHHAARVALTGARDGYFEDYTGHAQEFVSCIQHGFLYQGQWCPWQQRPRGAPLRGSPASSCVVYLQNHDQVGNTFTGERLHSLSAPASYRALSALMLLAPQTPLIFMGQEFSASARFMFFADHNPELASQVHAGRREFLQRFRAYSSDASQALIPDPAAPDTFLGSKLDWSEARSHEAVLRMHRDLLRLRAVDPVISRQDGRRIEGAILTRDAFVLRWVDDRHGDRLLLVNLGSTQALTPPAQPLLAPPPAAGWTVLWASEEPSYGGHGVISPATAHGRGEWRIAGPAAVLLAADAMGGTQP